MRLDLDGLAAASRVALMSEWREVVGRPPPKNLSRPLMVQILSQVLSDKSAQASEALGAWILRGDKRAPLCKSSIAV